MLIVFSFFFWLFLLIILKKLKLHFFYFLIGSVGIFTFMMFLGIHKWDKYLSLSVIHITGYLERYLNIYDTYIKNQLIVVYFSNQAVSFFVDYECSGFVEILVYIALLSFYPVYQLSKRIILTIIGIIYIILANVFRVLIIIISINFFGIGSFFIFHSVVARILFFILVVVLYYNIFTKPHILQQRVGGLTHAQQ